jgi:GMP synthase (glutamine-hydrolysing)
MKIVVAVQHVGFEDLGSFAAVLAEREFKIMYVEARTSNLSALDAAKPDLLALLGGPIGVYDDAEYPFVRDEIRLAERRMKQDLPILGICLGAQMMARALGSRVYPGPRKEIGWKPLVITEAGMKSPVRHLAPERTSMFHWHGDTFDLPRDATLLASTDACENQIFSWGRHALAFQCHPELMGARIERWLVGHACELGVNGIRPSALREETKKHSAKLEACGKECFAEWLAQRPDR